MYNVCAGVRMPPGPPPGIPPRVTRPLLPKPLGVLSAKPQINKVTGFNKYFCEIFFSLTKQ